MAEKGITFPAQPLPARKPDPQLANLPYHYALLQQKTGLIYSSLEDALANKSPVGQIASGEGLKFISYIDTYDKNGDNKPEAFMLASGGWMSSRDISSRWGSTTRFQGLEFTQTPRLSFGWIIPINPSVETKRTPSFNTQDYTGHIFAAYDVVTVYDVVQEGDTEWYMVGPDEWVEGRLIGRVIPNLNPPEGINNGRWIEINLFEQTLAVYEYNQLVFATLIASGLKPFYTRPGLFPIYKKLERTLMSGAFEASRSDFYYLEDVPWTLYYDQSRALHGAYWRARLGFPQSHGCVNLSPGDAQWLFNWAHEGDWVYVWDPSGQTPVDDSAYTQGGA
jgi:hypothetical protein